jgi:release factor glutamine methyltransferase
MVDRRVAGLPLEQVLGWAQFCGLRIAVDVGVFVPRRRTEFLFRRAAALASPHDIIVDLCCGAGAIGAALAASVSELDVRAVDIDPAAVACARRNLEGFGGLVYEGDLFDPLPPALCGRVAIIVANVPYVPSDEVRLLPAEARVHEPRVALDGGPDGLDVLRRVAAGAPDWLVPGGHLLIETSEGQVPRALSAFAASGLAARAESSADLYATVVIGTDPRPERARTS